MLIDLKVLAIKKLLLINKMNKTVSITEQVIRAGKQLFSVHL